MINAITFSPSPATVYMSIATFVKIIFPEVVNPVVGIGFRDQSLGNLDATKCVKRNHIKSGF